MAEFDNPLTSLREMVAGVLTDFAPLVNAFGDISRVQLFDQDVDARGDMADHEAMGKRCQLEPGRHSVNFNDSSSSILFTRRYTVGVYGGGVAIKPLEYIEWHLTRGLLYLFMKKQPGTTDTIVEPAPLLIRDITVTEVDPERDPLEDTEEWKAVCDVVVIAEAAIADLMIEEAPEPEPGP